MEILELHISKTLLFGVALSTVMSLSDKQRERVITDIVNHLEQVEPISDGYQEQLNNMTDEELRSEWEGTVGISLMSRADLSVGPDDLDDIYQKVYHGEDRQYGFS